MAKEIKKRRKSTRGSLKSSIDTMKGPFDAPDSKKEKRIKTPKLRIHIYISEGCLERIDEKAEELGIDDRSPCVQFLLNYALNILKNNPAPSDLEVIKLVNSA